MDYFVSAWSNEEGGRLGWARRWGELSYSLKYVGIHLF